METVLIEITWTCDYCGYMNFVQASLLDKGESQKVKCEGEGCISRNIIVRAIIQN